MELLWMSRFCSHQSAILVLQYLEEHRGSEPWRETAAVLGVCVVLFNESFQEGQVKAFYSLW